MDLQQFNKNRAQVGLEELEKYTGKYVAWDPSGTCIVAAHEDEVQLHAAIIAKGLDPAEILVSFVPPSDEVILGSQQVQQ